MAAVTARAIRAARPSATIVLGGTSRLDRRFLRAVLADGRNPLAGQIDVAAVHLRGSLSRMRAGARACARFFRRMGVGGPLWITETGYPSNPGHQWDRTLAGGERDQARWIARGPRELIDGGAARVFVTLRDGPEFGPQSAFASEGVVRWPQLSAGRARHPEARVRRAAPARRHADRLTAAPGPAGDRPVLDRPGQARSNRSRFMTLTHAATKSRTNFSRASSLA